MKRGKHMKIKCNLVMNLNIGGILKLAAKYKVDYETIVEMLECGKVSIEDIKEMSSEIWYDTTNYEVS